MINDLDRPIFLVGNARGGSTVLAAIINYHSNVGPKPDFFQSFDNINQLLYTIFDNQSLHYSYASNLEQKDIWFDYFPGRGSFTTMGKEMIVERLELDEIEVAALVNRLTSNFGGERFFSKAPSNSFRVRVLKQIFPDAKIVALLRSGVEVVGSYMGWEYRKSYKNMGYLRGITKLSKRWNETIAYLGSVREELGIHVVHYDDLIEETAATLESLFSFLELPVEEYVSQVSLEDTRSGWKSKIPKRYQLLAQGLTMKQQNLLDELRKRR